jgi:hypothetical protein
MSESPKQSDRSFSSIYAGYDSVDSDERNCGEALQAASPFEPFDSKQPTDDFLILGTSVKQSSPLITEISNFEAEKENVDDLEIAGSNRDDDLDVDLFTRSIVPETDDPSMPQFSFRVLVLGTFWCVAFAGAFFFLTRQVANMCLSFRTNPFNIDTSVAILLSYPLGRLMARLLPKGILNPGDFNVKEHVLISIIAGAGGAGSRLH